MEKELIIDIDRLDDEGEEIEGEVDIVDIDEEFVKPFGGVRYRFFVKALGSELLVQGRMEQDFDLVCSRCGKDFDDTVKVDDFTTSVEIDPKSGTVDLTQEVRESIILALPTFPLCDEACPGIERKSDLPADERWGALDGVKVVS